MTRSALVLVSIAVLYAVTASPAAAAPDSAACKYKKWRSLQKGSWPRADVGFTFRFNTSTIPTNQPETGNATVRYDKTRFERRILSGSNTWHNGRNRCDFFQRGGFDIYRGSSTSARADNWGDDTNTVDLGGDINLRDTCPGPGIIACTHLISRRDSADQRYIREIDIRFNPRKRWWTGIRKVPSTVSPGAERHYDLWTVAAHEFGHSLGFAHNSSDEDAPADARAQIMYTFTERAEQRRYLQGSDYTAMCTVYPGC